MQANTYALRSVAEDLEYLSAAWSEGTTDADLRRGSAILRRFLVDGGQGVLVSLWHEMGFERQPVVVSPSLSAATIAASNSVILATVGGATVDGIQIAGYLRATAPVEDNFNPDGHAQSIPDYTSAPCIVVYGQSITRRELVNYFANHLGGVHLGRRVLKKQAEFIRLFRRIEELPVQAELVGKDLLHFELLAIGQAVAQSEDCRKLASAIRAHGC